MAQPRENAVQTKPGRPEGAERRVGKSMRLVVTRPLEDSERSATALRARGYDVLIAPLLRIEPVPVKLSPSWGGVVVTSANAPAAVAALPVRDALVRLPLYAVGQRSAAAARDAGFTEVRSAGGDVRDLIRLLLSSRADAAGPLLYLAGEDRAADLASELTARGIAAEMAVVYRAAAAPFPEALIAALTGGVVDAVLHYSRRSADTYVTGAAHANIAKPALAVRHYCLSAPIAEPLVAAGAAHIAIAARPDETALFATLDATAM
jgi:uroporphyrinogen-III synthase